MSFRNPTIFVVTIILSAIAISCQPVYRKMMGVNTMKEQDDYSIRNYAVKLNIPRADIFKLDSSFLKYLVKMQIQGFQKAMHDHMQPLQAVYYDPKNKVLSYHVNCYAKSKGAKPDWNADGMFSVFPPAQMASTEHSLTLSEQLESISPIDGATPIDTASSNYTVFVYWNIAWGKMSADFIRIIQQNVSRAPGKARIVYVNNDNFLAGKLSYKGKTE